MSEENVISLSQQLMDLTKQMLNSGNSFSLSLSMTDFKFSASSKIKKSPDHDARKRKNKSASQKKRDFNRKQHFLNKKLDVPNSPESSEKPELFSCEHCDYKNSKKQGLDTHMQKKHKVVPVLHSTPEILRNPSSVTNNSKILTPPKNEERAEKEEEHNDEENYESEDISSENVSETECTPGPCLFCNEVFHTEEGIMNHLLTTCLENLKSQLFAMGVAVDSLNQAKMKTLLRKVLEIAKSDKV